MVLYIQFVNMKGMKSTSSANKYFASQEIKCQCIWIKANLYDLSMVVLGFWVFFHKPNLIFFFTFPTIFRTGVQSRK